MRTKLKPKVLAYPEQAGFTKAQVLREIRHFRYPKAWRYDYRNGIHYLVLEPRLFEKHYLNKKTHRVSHGRIPPAEKEEHEFGGINVRMPRLF